MRAYLLYVDLMLAHLIKYLTTHSSLSLSFNKNNRDISPSLLSALFHSLKTYENINGKTEVISLSNQIRAAAEPLSHSVTHLDSEVKYSGIQEP